MATTEYKRKVKYATTNAVAAQVKVWDSTVVQCRSWRHSWEPYSAVESPGMFCEIQACSRCGAMRYRMLGAGTGIVLMSWQSNLPEGYLMPYGVGRIAGHTFNVVRLAAMSTVKAVKVANEKELRAELRSVIRGE